MPDLPAPYPLLDGRIVTFPRGESSFIAAMFTAKTLGIFDQTGALPSDNLTTNPIWADGDTGWTTRLTGPSSQVTYAESNTHLLPEGADPQLLVNGGFDAGATAWTVVVNDASASVNFLSGVCELVGGSGNNQFAAITQEVLTTKPGQLHSIEGILTGDLVKLRIGTLQGDGDILDIATFDGTNATFTPPGNTFWVYIESEDNNAVSVIGSLTVAQDTIGSAGIAQQVTTTNGGQPHTVRVGATGGQEYRVRVGTAEGDGTYLDQLSSSNNFTISFTPAGDYWITIDAFGDRSNDVTLTSVYSWFAEEFDSVAFVTPYLESELRDLYFAPTPEEITAYVLHENHPPYKLSYDSGTGTYFFNEVIFTGAPLAWVPNNYPGVGTYFQGRLWLASTRLQGQTFWASQSGSPENFTIGVNDDDGLDFTLANFGKIEWMIGTKNLLIGTRNGEYIVRGDDTLSNIITPSSASVDQQSSYGSKSVQPLQIGDQVFYISPDGKKVRAMQYEWAANNWLSKDLTFFSEHITKTGIRDIAWAQHPDQLLWCILENGECAVLTYERGEDIYGWHKHITDGYFRDAAAGQLNGTSYLVALIQREEGNIFLEIQEPESYFDSNDESTYSGPEATGTYFLGFDHLIGKTVQVLLDNAVHPDVIVDQSGGITTEWAGTRCQAGLKFTPKLVTLPYDRQIQTGNVQLYQKRYNKLYISFLDSALPIINGKRPPVRTPPTPMDLREPNKEGLSRTETYHLGRDKDAQVTIEQDLPLACTVLSISGELSSEKL